MSRVILPICALLLSSAPSLPVAAAELAATQADGGQRCQNQNSRRRRGSIIGGIAGRALGRVGAPSSVAGVGLPTNELLSEAITSMLDCREQQQAAAATNQAIRGGVGSTSSWQSETRPGVSGSSTVTGQTATADGSQCLTVSDLVIVEGQEQRVPKTMCRRPPTNRYVRV